jgi:lysophospholipase L1-like esterase
MFPGRLLALLFVFSSLLLAQPAKTTIQDTLYKADGTPFIGTAIITWHTFLAGDTTAIGMQSVTVAIVNGAVFVQLVPNTNATPVNLYTVHYNSDGREQFTETWAVPPSTTPLHISAVRVTAGSTTTGGGGGGGSGGSTPVLETDVVGLSADLTIRPIKGAGFSPSRAANINDAGEIEGVVGNSDDCVHVDGSSAPCAVSSSVTTFVDVEIPAGIVDGVNTSFTLASAPSPAAGLSLYRNGVFQTVGTDFILTANVIQFLAGATPQVGDFLTAMYRMGGAGSITTSGSTSTGNLQIGDLSLAIVDTAFQRRGHKTMAFGDSQTGNSVFGDPFPTMLSNWFSQAAVASQSRIRYAGNAGVLGDTTANMLNRLIPDVIANNPDKVFIEAGYGDINLEIPVATIADNINTMVNRLKAAKILPILCTLPPRLPNDVNGPSPQSTLSVVQLNFQLRQIADAQGIPLVDFYAILVDPVTGLYQTGYSADNINPAMPATRLMAQAAIAVLGGTLDNTSPWLPANDNDGINLLQGPWVQTVTSGVAAGFTSAPVNTLTLQKTDTASVDVIKGTAVTAGFSPGDRLAFTGTIVSTNCESGALQFDVSLQFNPGATSMYPMYHWSVDIAAGQWYVEFTVPGGATSMTPVIQLNRGTGTVALGRIGVANLTALGF